MTRKQDSSLCPSDREVIDLLDQSWTMGIISLEEHDNDTGFNCGLCQVEDHLKR